MRTFSAIFAVTKQMQNFEGISLILTFDPKHLSHRNLNWMFNQENDFVMPKGHDFHFLPLHSHEIVTHLHKTTLWSWIILEMDNLT